MRLAPLTQMMEMRATRATREMRAMREDRHQEVSRNQHVHPYMDSAEG